MKIFYFKLNRHIISMLLGLVCATPLFAQTGKTVTGTVKDHNHLLSGVRRRAEPVRKHNETMGSRHRH